MGGRFFLVGLNLYNSLFEEKMNAREEKKWDFVKLFGDTTFVVENRK